MIRMIKMRPSVVPDNETASVICSEALRKALADPMCVTSEVVTAYWMTVPIRIIDPTVPYGNYVFVGVRPGYPPDEPFDENGEYPGWGDPGWGE